MLLHIYHSPQFVLRKIQLVLLNVVYYHFFIAESIRSFEYGRVFQMETGTSECECKLSNVSIVMSWTNEHFTASCIGGGSKQVEKNPVGQITEEHKATCSLR